MDKLRKILLPFLAALCLLVPACSTGSGSGSAEGTTAAESAESVEAETGSEGESDTEESGEGTEDAETDAVEEASSEDASSETESFDLSAIPEYSGEPYVVLSDNIPDFEESDLITTSFESYSELDSLGRCGAAYANIGLDLMPTEERDSISSVTPTGWHSVTYDIVDGEYLYNRCHLIGYQLTAENANELNLITGTRYLNVEGMLPFENMVADYIEETGNHVLYRVTPIFEGDNLVASGVQMEAMSVEDHGEGILFNIYCYNVQPGIVIDYATGDSWLEEDDSAAEESEEEESKAEDADTGEEKTYILNTNSGKFHDPSCSSVEEMSAENKQEYTGTREEVIAMGYEPCGRCNP